MVTTTKLGSKQPPPGLDQRVGRILFDNGVLSEVDYERVLAAQREQGGQFSEIALRLGVISERDMRRALARQCELATNPESDKVTRHLSLSHQPDSERAEALRSLRSELSLRWFNNGRVALAVGEVRPDQGAAVLTANLACAFAQLGRRTLLIDANLRHPEQQDIFKLDNKWGLTGFLNGCCSLHEAINTVPGFDQLSVMLAGTPPSNPQELLSLESFGFMLEAATDTFDVVLVVSAPILDSADMQIVAARAGGCLVMAGRHRTQVADLQRVEAYFAPTATTLVGMVLEG